MLTVRRLYWYAVSGVGLGLLLGGLTILLRLILMVTGLGGSSGPVAGYYLREQISLSLSVVVVGALLFGGHTWWVDRTIRQGGTAGDAERRSVLRAVYFAVAMGTTLAVGATAAADVLQDVLRRLAGISTGSSLAEPIATAVVTLAAFGYLAWARLVDVRGVEAAPLEGASAWISRLEAYGAAFTGAIAVLVSVSGLLELGLRVLVDRPYGPYLGADWWISSAVGNVTWTIVGALILVPHWLVLTRLLRETPAAANVASDGSVPLSDSRTLAAAERNARMRTAFLVGLFLVGLAMFAVSIVTGATTLVGVVLGIADPTDPARLVEDILGPPITTLPFGAAAWWALHRATAEALAFGGAARWLSVRRLGHLLAALVGLALAAPALAQGLGVVLDVLLGASWTSNLGRLDGSIALAVVGLPIWYLAWRRLQRMAGVEPAVEAASIARRAYLVLVGGVALVAAATEVAWLLYRLLRVVMGLEGVSLGSDVSSTVAVLLVALVALAYHGAVLRRGLRLAERPAGPIVEELELVGPAGADLEALHAALRERLPDGFTLRVRGTHA